MKIQCLCILIITYMLVLLPFAHANSFNADGSSCNISAATTLQQLCPAGFGMPNYPPVASQISNNPNNANMIVQAAKYNAVPVNLALAVAASEGGMSSCAGSNTGVKGPMQVTIGTANGYGLNRNINTQNIKAGVLTLKHAISVCGSSSDIACLASVYNGSTAAQQKTWTGHVSNYLGQMASKNLSLPMGCNVCTGSGGLTTPNNAAGTVGTPSPTNNWISSSTPLTT
ncbi:MAG: lytic transglycosylase domain-containing protein [Hyphomicrobiales bacterium]|nr:lytic transglycosylase domain-containing protein [Hyphomicrobiales bacterium]MDE2116026.1 transglycosylase SLT domain-containing protein [Hyphomicrobiales bacterium]